MPVITVYDIEVNGINGRLYWSEINGRVESMITGLSNLKPNSSDPYYDTVVIEEWLTMAIIEGCRKHDTMKDDDSNVVLELFILNVTDYVEHN